MTMEEYQALGESQEVNLIKNFFQSHQAKGYTVNQLLIYIQAYVPEISSLKLHKTMEILFHQHVLERKKSGHHFRYRLKK